MDSLIRENVGSQDWTLEIKASLGLKLAVQASNGQIYVLGWRQSEKSTFWAFLMYISALKFP